MTMELNSQVCTTEEQSLRLLALGLKKETADMCWNKLTLHGTPVTYPSQDVWSNYSIISDSHFPAWSLHRLIEMIPSFIDIGEHSYMFSIIQGKLFSYDSDIGGNVFLYGKDSVYDSVIYTIEWLIKIGEFNKNYLDIH